MEPGAPMRVATFNVMHGRSLSHGEVRPAELADAVQRIGADVLCLQEVDHRQDRSGAADQTGAAAAAMGAAAWRFVPALLGTPGSGIPWTAARGAEGELDSGPSFGVGLVSRYPVTRWLVRRFPAPRVSLPLPAGPRRLLWVRDEPRVALAAVIDAPGGPVTVLTTHLSFVPGWNAAQLIALSRWARALPSPRLIAGDVNLPGALPRLASGWRQLARIPTYPSFRPRVQFDHVLADGVPASAVTGTAALRLPVSDHCALIVDLDGSWPG
jgi:endonuclease/exonuclease/phosphatase family metal-dependent hydrolase